MNFIDEILNKITIYRLAVYVLAIFTGLGVVFAFLGKMSFTPTNLVVSFMILIVSTYIVDRVFGRIFNTPNNTESALITALILLLIMAPAHSTMTGIALLVAGAAASASKFLLSYNGKHIFNPAAFAAALLSLAQLDAATWWIGNSIFWPFTFILGLAIIRKVRRAPLVTAFVVISAILEAFVILHSHQTLDENYKHALLASPLIFLSTIMLTEPATMPPRRNQQMIFGALVAVLYVMAWKIGPLTIYPEVALLIGNIFAFIISPKFKVRLELKEVQQVSDRVYNYIFQPERRFAFLPGQYMEWTLPNVPYDSRGNRRTFTIASSPTENEVHLGMKYYEPASMFKATFAELKPGDTIYASQLAGNFTLNGNEDKKLAFIAGGIGITPFRSMIKYIADQNLKSDVVLLYVVSDRQEFAYAAELKAAREQGVRTVPIVTEEGHSSSGVISAKLSPELISKAVPDFGERIFYVSGPNQMVDSTKKYLHSLGVSINSIKTDHFSGY